MNKTADVLSFKHVLTFFSKNILQSFNEKRGLLKIFKPSNSRLQHHQPQFKNIQRPIYLHVRLIVTHFGKVFLSRVHIEDTE